MHYLEVGIFEHLEIMVNLDLYLSMRYTYFILTGPDLEKYCEVLLAYKEKARGYYRNQLNFGAAKDMIMDNLLTWTKVYWLYFDGDIISGEDHCRYFEKELLFGLGKYRWRKKISNFQEHVKYINNGIFIPFWLRSLQYNKRVHEVHNISKHLSPPLKKGNMFYQE